MKTNSLISLALTAILTGFVSHEIADLSQPATPPKLAKVNHYNQLKTETKPAVVNPSFSSDTETFQAVKLAEAAGILTGSYTNDPVKTDIYANTQINPVNQRRGGKTSSLSPLLTQVTDLGVAEPSQPINISIGLQLRNQAGLDAFLADVSNPESPNYQQYLTQEQFNAAYAPTTDQQQKVMDWLTDNGFSITQTFENHLVIYAVGTNANAAQAFSVNIHNVSLANEVKYAAFEEPAFPGEIANLVTGVGGLDNLTEMKPKAVFTAETSPSPHAALGSNCCHFSPNDIKAFYDDNSALYSTSKAVVNGNGQTVVIAGAYAWNTNDVNGFNKYWGLAQFSSANSLQVCTGAANSPGCQFNYPNSMEISLDAEYLHASAPNTTIKNYMAASAQLTSFTAMYNRIVLDNPGHVVTTSWGTCESQTPLSIQIQNDSIIANGNAIGQSWFAASGDYGSDACGNHTKSVDHPANSPHVIGVGGTSPTCSSGMKGNNPVCSGYGSETAWSGSGGGISTIFGRPSYQTGCGIVPSNYRQVPDVSLAADPNQYGYYVAFDGYWYLVGGTSAAAPQWAGYFAQLNQYKPGNGKGLGLPAGRMYALCETNAFHDITTGSNGAYKSGLHYDNVTGIGSINVLDFFTDY